MANFSISKTLSFTDQVRQFETTDPAHADLFNAVVQTLLENDVFLKKVTDALQERKADKESLTSCWHDSFFETPGWYRIARCSNPSCVSCTINLKRTYSTVNNEYHKLELISAYRKSRFEAVADTVNDHNRLITNVRHVLTAKDTGADKENFIDFYYDSTNRNAIMAIIENCLHNGYYPGGAWQMLDEPQKVPEATEGETVLASIHTFENYWVGDNPSPGEIGAVATEAGSKYSIKYYTDKAFSDLDMFPLKSEYGKSFIRVFSNVFDGIVVENSSATGNYANQLYLSSDGMRFRKRQGGKTYESWIDTANDLPLSLAKGGTGKTTAADAANVLINGLGAGTDAPQDEDAFISQYAGGGKNGQNTFYRRPVSKLWDYIKSHLRKEPMIVPDTGWVKPNEGGSLKLRRIGGIVMIVEEILTELTLKFPDSGSSDSMAIVGFPPEHVISKCFSSAIAPGNYCISDSVFLRKAERFGNIVLEVFPSNMGVSVSPTQPKYAKVGSFSVCVPCIGEFDLKYATNLGGTALNDYLI